ncbi:hypothetical protein B0H14DRAFT_2580427 [Mycena olivaceomarginata]|nr:hypothetical protein B0H14DRAFT_2639832 [Mycena olivaceomarginata]KAJ7853583.1 hypothetical protein B0H14DRAFT_2580427 [Mycena olivaceomarginata]
MAGDDAPSSSLTSDFLICLRVTRLGPKRKPMMILATSVTSPISTTTTTTTTNGSQLLHTPGALLVHPDPSPQNPTGQTRKEKKTVAQRTARQVKRELRPQKPSPSSMRQSSPIPFDFKLSIHPAVASTGWMGCAPPTDFEPEAREYTLEEATEVPGMRVLEWQGKPGPLVDADRYVFGLFAGQPRDPKWQAEVADEAARLMEEAAEGIYDKTFSGVYYGTRKGEKRRRKRGAAVPLDQKIPRRGPHRAKSMGNSMGGGQEVPTGFVHNIVTAIVLTGLLAQKPFQRIAGFTNALFQAYAPGLHGYYSATLNDLHDWNRRLKRNFLPSVSVFAAATFNFGLRTVTIPTSTLQTLHGAGSTILIPSALLRHSNTSIQRHEKRFSFTQYTPAGIFRFVGNKFRSDKKVNESVLTSTEQLERVEARRNRWDEGLKMYHRWEFVHE